MTGLLACEEGRELVRQINARADNPNEKRVVNRYAAALLMPRAMITEDAMRTDRTQWPPLYRLAKRYDVTISALVVRLEQLNLLYVDQTTRTPYPSLDVALGQMRLMKKIAYGVELSINAKHNATRAPPPRISWTLQVELRADCEVRPRNK